ncbi:MAG: PQQ-binding-like beta-propeller repeat protein [Elusimicrobia bacterium]|nr:PQQ-binding-like beta-propeller repeat protein [Elusimicrobiota bacterium]
MRFTFFLFFALSSFADFSKAGNWPMWRYNAARNGYNSSENRLSPPFQLSWRALSGPALNVTIESSPAIANGKVYVTSVSGEALYCFDLISGTLLWNTSGIPGTTSSPSVENGKVYFLSWDGYLYCLDAQTGGFQWRTKLADIPQSGFEVRLRASPIIRDGKLYIGTTEGLALDDYKPALFTLDARTGAVLAKRVMETFQHQIYGSPALYGSLLFVGVGGYQLEAPLLMCFDVSLPSQITKLWERPMQGRAMNTPAVSEDGIVFYIPFGNGGPSRIFSFRADASGSEVRAPYLLDTPVYWYMSPAIAYNSLYIGVSSSFLCIDLAAFSSGAANPIRWRYDAPSGSPTFIGSPAVANGFVYASTDDIPVTVHEGAFHGFNAFTGESAFYFAGGDGRGVGSAQGGPAVGDGHVIFISYDDEDSGIYGYKMAPSPSGEHFTIKVASEYFVFYTTNPDTIHKASSAYDCLSNPQFGCDLHVNLHPNGLLHTGTRPDNPRWSWHFDGWDIWMAEQSAEICDASPSYVEANLSTFLQQSQGRYCPWQGRVVYKGLDSAPPSVSILSPAEWATVSGIVNVSASATDNAGVAAMEAYVGQVRIASTTTNPWNFKWDTRRISNGNKQLTIKAFDPANNMGIRTIWVTVSNSSGGGGGGPKLLPAVSVVDPQNPDSPLQTLSLQEGESPRALLISSRGNIDQNLVFGPQVTKASIVNLSGRQIFEAESQGGNPLIFTLQQAGGKLLCESGLLLIQMHIQDGDNRKVMAKPMLCVK